MTPRTHWALRAAALAVLVVLHCTGCSNGRTLDPKTAASEPAVVIVYPSAVCARRYDNPPPSVVEYDRQHIVEGEKP